MRVFVLSFLLLSACGAPVTTEAVRRTFPLEVLVTAPTAPNDTGWTVTDVSGTAELASLRFFTGKVLISRWWNPLDLIVTPAFAHPGHYMEGEALGEATTPVSIDLSKRTAQAWQVANAVTGSYGSAQLIYATSGLRVRGTATKGGQTVRFDTGTLVPTKPLEGLKFEREMDTSAGTVRVQLDLGVMLSRVDFSQTGATAGADGVVLLAPTSVAFNGFDRGVLDTGSYIISWQSN